MATDIQPQGPGHNFGHYERIKDATRIKDFTKKDVKAAPSTVDASVAGQAAIDAVRRELEDPTKYTTKFLRHLRETLSSKQTDKSEVATGKQGSLGDQFRLNSDDRKMIGKIGDDKKEKFVKTLIDFRNSTHSILYDSSCDTDEITKNMIELRKKLFLNRDWTKGLPQNTDRDISAAYVAERKEDQMWIKFIDRVLNSFYKDASSNLSYISSHHLFAAAEHAVHRGDTRLAIKNLQKLMQELRPGESEYAGVKSPNVITREGKLEVPEIDIHGNISSRLLDLQHIQSAKSGYIIDESGNTSVKEDAKGKSDAKHEHAAKYHAVNIYDIYKPDPIREAYSCKEAAKKGKADSNEYHLQLKQSENDYDKAKEKSVAKAINLKHISEIDEIIHDITDSGGSSQKKLAKFSDNKSEIMNVITRIEDVESKGGHKYIDNEYLRSLAEKINDAKDIKDLEEARKSVLPNKEGITKDLKEAIEDFKKVRVEEDVSVTRMVVMAQAANLLERRAARGLREADRKYTDFLKREKDDRWDTLLIDGERKELIDTRDKRLHVYNYYSRTANDAWTELAVRKNLTVVEAKDHYLEKSYVYAVRGDNKVEIYTHVGKSGSGIKLQIDDIDFGKSGKNESKQAVVYFKHNSDPLTIPWKDDLFEMLRMGANDLAKASVKSAEKHIDHLLELLRDNKQSEFAKEDAIRIAFATVRIKEQRLRKTLQALELGTPQMDQTLFHQQIWMTHLETLSGNQILELNSRSLDGTFTATQKRREEITDIMKSWMVQAMKQGKAAVIATHQGIEKVARYEHPLRKDTSGFTGLAYDIHARAGKMSQVEVTAPAEEGTGGPVTQPLTAYLTEELKRIGPEVRSKIIKHSLFEAYFKYANSPSVRDKALDNILREYGVASEPAESIIANLKQTMSTSLKSWEAKPMSSDISDGTADTVRKCLGAIPSLRERNEMINRAAAVYFRSDFPTDEERKEAIIEAFSKQKDDDQEAHFLDSSRTNTLVSKLHTALQGAHDEFLRSPVSNHSPQQEDTITHDDATSQMSTITLDSVEDILYDHKWTEATLERKARAIIKSAAEAREKTEGVHFLEFQHVAKQFFDAMDDETLDRMKKTSRAIRDEGIEDARANLVAHRVDVQIKSWLETDLTSNNKITFNGNIETFMNTKGVSTARLAKMVRASIEAYARQAPLIKEGKEAATKAFCMHADEKISAGEAEILVNDLLQGHEKIRNGLWDVTEAMFAHIYCHDSFTHRNTSKDSQPSGSRRSDAKKMEYEKAKREIYNRLTLKDEGPLVDTHVEDWLAKEAEAKYDHGDQLNLLWKNRQRFAAIYSGCIEDDNFKENKKLEFLTKRLKPIDLDVLDDKLYSNLSEQEKGLLRSTMQFQNQWIHNLKSAVDRYIKNEKSEMMWDDVVITLQHSRHQISTMEYERQIALEALDIYNQGKPEQGKEMLKYSPPQDIGKPLQDSNEVYREMTKSISILRKEIDDKLNALLNDKEVKITPLELIEKLQLWTKEAASVNSRKEIVDLALQGRLDEAFKSSFRIHGREKALLEQYGAWCKQALKHIEDIKKSNSDFEHKQEGIKLAAREARVHLYAMILIVAITNGNQTAMMANSGFQQFAASVIRNATR